MSWSNEKDKSEERERKRHVSLRGEDAPNRDEYFHRNSKLENVGNFVSSSRREEIESIATFAQQRTGFNINIFLYSC